MNQGRPRGEREERERARHKEGGEVEIGGSCEGERESQGRDEARL